VVGFEEAEIIRPEEKEVTKVEERCADTSGVSSASGHASRRCGRSDPPSRLRCSTRE